MKNPEGSVQPGADSLEAQHDRRLVELQSLFELSKTLNASLNIKKVLDVLLLTPMGRMMISTGAVLLTHDHGVYCFERMKGLPSELAGKTVALQIDGDDPRQVDDLTDKATVAFLRKHNLDLVCPIQNNNQTLGVLALGPKLSGLPFTPDDLEYLSSIANLAAPALDNSRYLRELQEVNRELDKKNQALNTLFDIGKELNSTLDREKIANTLAYAIMGEMMVQQCIILCTGQENDLEILAAKGLSPARSLHMLQDDEVQKVLLQTHAPLLLRHADNEAVRQAAEADKMLLYVPMLSQDVVKGGVLVGERLNASSFDEMEQEFLSTLANAAMISFENARLFQETLEKQRLEEELSIARDIQKKLLPDAPPSVPGYDFAGMNDSTHQVGGDYYDFIPIDGEHIAIAIGDVSGKGVPASLLMANVQASLHALIHADWPLADIVSRINNIIYANTSMDKFITFFIGVIELTTGKFTYVNAGHNPPMLRRRNGDIEELHTGGLILGMMPDAPFQQATLDLFPGDELILFTDGVSEAMNEEDEEFTEERIAAILRESKAESAQALLDEIKTAVKKFTRNMPQSDDITMLAMRIQENGAVGKT